MRCTILQCIIFIPHCVFTTPSQVSVHQHLSPKYLPPPPTPWQSSPCCLCPCYFLLWSNIHNIKFAIFTISVYNSVLLSTFTLLCLYHHHSPPESFYDAKQKTLSPLNYNYPSPLPKSLLTSILHSVLMSLTIWGIEYKCNHTISVLWCLAYFI